MVTVGLRIVNMRSGFCVVSMVCSVRVHGSFYGY